MIWGQSYPELASDPTPEGLNLDGQISNGGCPLMVGAFFFQERAGLKTSDSVLSNWGYFL